jgi:ABC-type Fe3+-siderophore transport system permease subunit
LFEDILEKVIPAPVIPTVGMMTSASGVPFFVYLFLE